MEFFGFAITFACHGLVRARNLGRTEWLWCWNFEIATNQLSGDRSNYECLIDRRILLLFFYLIETPLIGTGIKLILLVTLND